MKTEGFSIHIYISRHVSENGDRMSLYSHNYFFTCFLIFFFAMIIFILWKTRPVLQLFFVLPLGCFVSCAWVVNSIWLFSEVLGSCAKQLPALKYLRLVNLEISSLRTFRSLRMARHSRFMSAIV